MTTSAATSTPSVLEGHALRVATVPASHVYVRHLAPVHPGATQAEVHRLPDPDPDRPGRSTQSKWWPPVMLEPDWVKANADDFDIFHVQFGFDACPPRRLEELADVLRAAGKPLVHTAHDLRNPHHANRAEHDAQLDVLVPAADAVITLTPGAADEIERRWRRRPLVLPHPHVVELEEMDRRRRLGHADHPFTVGLHVKSLRACMDPMAVLSTLVRAVQQIPGAVLQVNGHRDVLERGGARYDAALAAALAAAPECVTVRVHDFFSDAELWDYLARLDVSVLPYRFGTHSGWLEACRDLGTAVVAPTCGYYADQGPVFGFTMDESAFDEGSLVDAILAAHVAGQPQPLDVEARVEQRDRVAAAHAELYRNLVS